jgi:DNA-binding NtrC family response regulator
MASILVVDNEPIVVQVAEAALKRAGHSVVAVSSGREALRAAAGMEIEILIVNHRIEPETGRAIAERLLPAHPEMKVIHISGVSRDQLEEEGSLTPGASFLAKPFTAARIQETVAEVLGS